MGDESDCPSEDGLTLGEMLDLLADRERRCLLNCLTEEADPTVSLDEAASYVSDQLADQTGNQPNEDDVKVKLQHHHIPRLVDHGLTDYDARSGDIRYYANEALEAFQEHIREFDQK